MASDELKAVKDKIRGVSGVLQRQGYNAGLDTKLSQTNNRIRKIFVEAKDRNSPRAYEDIFDFTRKIIPKSQLYLALNPSKLSRVVFSGKSRKVSFIKEVLWSSEKIKFFSDEVSRYLRYREFIDSKIFKGDFVCARKITDRMEREIGRSIWSAKKKQQIASLDGGLKKQKEVSDAIRREAGPGPISFIIHQESIRLESTTKISKYESDNIRRLSDYKKINHLKSFLLYSLSCDFGSSNRELAELLSCADVLSIIDGYEALVEVLIKCALEKVSFEGKHGEAIRKSISIISEFNDERAYFLNEHFNENYSIEDVFYDDIKDREMELIQKAVSFPKRQGRNNGIYESLNRIIFRNDPMSSQDDLKKICKSFPGYMQTHWILNLAKQDMQRNYKIIDVGRDDFSLRYGCLKESLDNNHLSSMRSILLSSAVACYQKCEERVPFHELVDAERKVLDCTCDLRIEDFMEWYKEQESIVRSYCFDVYIKNGSDRDLPVLLSMLSSERVRVDGCHDYVGIVDVYQSYGWERFSSVTDLLDKALFFDFLHNRTGDSRHETYKRFCLEDIFSDFSVSSVDDFLRRVPSSDDRYRVILKNVCSPSIIDMLDCVVLSKYVDYERKRICECIIDKFGDDDSVSAEIESIKASIRLHEISEFVDSNKVFVDQDGMAAWIKRNLKQDFDRFLSLVDTNKGMLTSIENLLIGQIFDPLIYNNADIDESDIQLFDIIEKMKRQFLFDPSFGLDGYLSKRVRHNTLHIFLRSAFKNSNFLTVKSNQASEYQESEYWRGRLSTLADEDARLVLEALKKFSQSFDNEVLRLVDNYLHVKSPEKPKGVLDIPLSDAYILTLKASAIEHQSLAMLSSHGISVFWAALKPSLDAAKKLLRETFSSKVSNVFDTLKGTIRKVADKYPGNDNLLDLGTEINRAHSAFVEHIDRAANWFSQSKAELKSVPQGVKESFSSVADYVFAKHPDREAKYTLHCSDGMEMQFQNVLMIADVIKDLIENALFHCGIERGAEVDIYVNPMINNKGLDIRVENNLSRSALEKAMELPRVLILSRISSGEWKKYVRKEGKSGLYKIWSSAELHGDARMDFGVSEESKFFVSVCMPIIGDLNYR